MKARVFVTLKNGVLDPQGKAIGHALNGLGFASVGEVRQGKVIDLELSETDEASARAPERDVRKAPRQYRDRKIRNRADSMRQPPHAFCCDTRSLTTETQSAQSFSGARCAPYSLLCVLRVFVVKNTGTGFSA